MTRRWYTVAAVCVGVFLIVPGFGAWASWVTGQYAQAVMNVLMFLTLAAAAATIWIFRPDKEQP